MRIVVSGGSGFIGVPLVRRLRADGHEVVQLVRRLPRTDDEVEWDPASGRLDGSALEGVAAAVNLSGAGVGDHRWTAEYRRTVRDSRVDASRTLSTALARLDPLPRVLLQSSGIDYYGADCGEEILLETHPPGDSFLSDVCVDWEASARPAVDAGIRVVHLRTGLVLGPGGGALERLLPLFKLGLGGRLGRGSAWWSWITLVDVLAAMRFLLEEDVHGPVNLVGPAPVTNAEFTKALASSLHRPALAVVPPFALRLGLGQFAENVLGSKRVVPQVLLDAGFGFEHRNIAAATAWLARA